MENGDRFRPVASGEREMELEAYLAGLEDPTVNHTLADPSLLF
jgi:hypothetical protein